MTSDHPKLVRSGAVLEAMAVGAPVWALGFLWLFRGWVFDGGDGIWGDQGDARALITWLEHWYRWFGGAEPDWRSPPFFFPERKTLGFSDAYFLYAIPYSVLRALQIDPFAAFMAVMALLSVIGFAGFMRLAIRHIHVSAPVAALGAFLFTFANMVAMKGEHAQTYCAMLLPVIIELVMSALDSSRRRAIVLASIAGLLHALVFLTAYLTGWFFTAFVLFMAIFWACLAGPARRDLLKHVFSKHQHVILAYGAGFLAGLVPFLWLYGPVLVSGFKRSINDHRTFAPWITDIINVGRDNLVWGRLLETIGIANQPQRPLWEVELGYSPGVFAVWMTFTAILFVRYRREPSPTGCDQLLLACGICLIAGWLIQLNWFGLRPWRAIYVLVPGATAVRTTFRAQIVDNLAACMLLVIAMSRLQQWMVTHRFSRMIVPALAGALIIEQLNVLQPVVFSRNEQLKFLADVPPPPPGCTSFYVVERATPVSEPWFVHQIDAMLVSVQYGIPTVNGSSSNFPRGWGFPDPSAPDYRDALRAWVEAKGISPGLCGLDPRIGRWVENGP